jgi:hypothetical protein
VPAACRQAAEYAVTGGVFIEMKGLRIELGGKALDPIAVQPRCNRSSAVGGIALTCARLPFYRDLDSAQLPCRSERTPSGRQGGPHAGVP